MFNCLKLLQFFICGFETFSQFSRRNYNSNEQSHIFLRAVVRINSFFALLTRLFNDDVMTYPYETSNSLCVMIIKYLTNLMNLCMFNGIDICRKYLNKFYYWYTCCTCNKIISKNETYVSVRF